MIAVQLSERRAEAEVRQAIESLDLEPIKVKLIDPKEGHGWTLEQANEVERWYRRFLFLSFKHSDKSIVPHKLIDEFWHQHILDTHKYQEDCEMVFGFFLHHFPYFGMRGEVDAKNLQNAFTETGSLYELEFGEAPKFAADGDAAKCDTCGASSCGVSDCGSSQCGPSTSCKGRASERNAMMVEIRPRLQPRR